MHKQIISTEIIAISRIPAPIPIIRTKLGRFPLSEVATAAGVEGRCGGVPTGGLEETGAVKQTKNNNFSFSCFPPFPFGEKVGITFKTK